jgi:hypothetical protein
MVKQKRNAFWSVFCLSVLFASLAIGIGIHGRTSGSVNSAASAAPQAPALIRPWTAVASTGVVDESALDLFQFGLPPVGGSAAGFRMGTFGPDPLVLRYNVTNTFDNNAAPNMPGWTRLELGSFAQPGSEVRARLYRVRPCNGYQDLVCTATNQGEGTNCRFCDASTLGPVDFGNFLYYVEVQLSRQYSEIPKAYTLRLY